jgi:hypothetical protein
MRTQLEEVFGCLPCDYYRNGSYATPQLFTTAFIPSRINYNIRMEARGKCCLLLSRRARSVSDGRQEPGIWYRVYPLTQQYPTCIGEGGLGFFQTTCIHRSAAPFPERADQPVRELAIQRWPWSLVPCCYQTRYPSDTQRSR